MAAPTPTARQSPTGIKLETGHQVLITFARDPDFSLWEKVVTPPGMEGGDAIDITTQHNTAWRTFAPRKLKQMSESQFTAGYDPNFYSQGLSLLNQRDTVTVTFPDGSTIAAYGYLKTFTPNGMQDGEFPEATCMVVITNYDHVNKVEAAPVVTSVSGT